MAFTMLLRYQMGVCITWLLLAVVKTIPLVKFGSHFKKLLPNLLLFYNASRTSDFSQFVGIYVCSCCWWCGTFFSFVTVFVPSPAVLHEIYDSTFPYHSRHTCSSCMLRFSTSLPSLLFLFHELLFCFRSLLFQSCCS